MINQPLHITHISQILAEIPVPAANTPLAVLSAGRALFRDWVAHDLREVLDSQILMNGHQVLRKGDMRLESLNLANNCGGDYLAAEYEHPCAQHPGRSWRTEFAISTAENNRVITGLRLSVHDRARNLPPPNASTPRMVRNLARTLGLKTHYNAELVDKTRYILTRDADMWRRVEDLVTLIENPARSLPVIVITPVSKYNNIPETLVDPNRLAKNTLGLAHVYYLDGRASHALREILGQELAVYNGSVRQYMPGFNRATSQGPDHPQMLSNNLLRNMASKNEATQFFINRAYDFSTRNPDHNAVLMPEFSALRTLHYRSLREAEEKSRHTTLHLKKPTAAESANVTNTVDSEKQHIDQINALEQRHADEIKAMAQQVEEALAMGAAEESRRIAAEARADELHKKLQSHHDIMPAPSLSKGLFPPLTMLSEWAKVCLPKTVVMTPRAIKSAKESVYRDPSLVYRSLILLGQEYMDMRLTDDNEGKSMKAFNQKALDLGIENRLSINPSTAGQYGDTYFVSFEGQRHFMAHHLARGNSFDPRNCMRIYFAYDETQERVLVGHLPDHLKNRLT